MDTREFEKAPATVPMMLKAALPAIPVVGKLPGVRHAKGSPPDLVMTRRDIETDPAHLHRYNEVCGFSPANTLPPTYPHMAAFPLHMAMMTDTSFPFAPMGLVHIRNSITQHRPIGVCENLTVRVHAESLRSHPKGQLIDIVTTASIDENVVWDETMTLFARGSSPSGPTKTANSNPLEGIEPPPGVIRWKLEGDLGRRYGAVSGDRNPIHLYPITAKAFGFKSNIAHGMWSKARCLAALHNRLPETYQVDVEFKKPILLPTTVNFGSAIGEAKTTFGMTAAQKPATHLVGRIVATS